MARTPFLAAIMMVSTIGLSACSGGDPEKPDDLAKMGPNASWEIPIDAVDLTSVYQTPSVLLVGDVLIHGSGDVMRDSGIAFSDIGTGDLLWSLEPTQHIVSVTSKFVVYLDEFGDEPNVFEIGVIDIGTGEVRFSHEYRSIDLNYTATSTEDAYFVIEDDASNNSMLTAVDLESGETRWQKPIEVESNHRTVLSPTQLPDVDSVESRSQSTLTRATESSVIYLSGESNDVGGGRVIDTSDGTLVSELEADIEFGWVAWQTQAGYTVLQPRETFDSEEYGPCTFQFSVVTPDFEEQQVQSHLSSRDDDWHCGSIAGRIHLSDAVTIGQTADHRPELVGIETGEIIWTGEETAMPILATDEIALYTTGYANTPSTVYAVNPNNGKTLWTSNQEVGGRNALIGDVLYTSWDYQEQDHSDGQRTRAIDIVTGAVTWQLPDTTLLAVNDTHIYVLKEDPQTLDKTIAAIPTG